MEEAPKLQSYIENSISIAVKEFSKTDEIQPTDSHLKWNAKIDVKINNKIEEFNLIIYFLDFPLSIPIICISSEDYNRIKGIPHVNSSGIICTFDQTVITDFSQPSEILRKCINRAKLIIKEGLEGKNINDFEEEFIPYWDDDGYNYLNTLSTLDYSLENPLNLKFYMIKKPFNSFNGLLVSGNSEEKQVVNYIHTRNRLTEVPVLYLGEIPGNESLFIKSNRASIDLIRKYKPNLLKALESHINSRKIPVIIFKKKVKEKNLFLGWIYVSAYKDEIFNPVERNNFDILSSPFYKGNEKVERLRTTVFTKERLFKRSAGLKSTMPKEIKLGIVGLGSIGSNLIPFLKPLSISELRLIDNEVMLIENLGRHFLGIDYVGLNKAAAVEKYLKTSNPYYNVEVRSKTLADIISNESEFLNENDFIFICIGNTNSEIFADMALKTKLIGKPLLFFWVEPFLAGGHCVYLTPQSNTNFKDLFKNTYYSSNVLSNDEYDKNLFTNREAGCQTSFTPYSLTNMISFLSALYPKLLDIINGIIKNGKSFTWIGDTNLMKEMKYKLSELGDRNKMGTIIEKDLL